MSDLSTRIASLDWSALADDMNTKGYAILPGILSAQQCDSMIERYDDADAFRKTVVMERYRFGLGEYKYWDYPLPDLVQQIRQELYPHLVPIVNHWHQLLGIEDTYPDRFGDLQTRCHDAGQLKPTPLILKYGPGGFNTLHQDLYGEVYFPLQVVINLNQPGEDFTGGEFVLTQQTPRAQSKAIVLTPNRGDMIIFTTNFRPVKSVPRSLSCKNATWGQ